MIRAWTLLLSFYLSLACESSKFEGKLATEASPVAQDDDAVAIAGEEGEAEIVENKDCELGAEGDLKSEVSVNHGDVDLSKVKPGSVLMLRVQGQARIDFTEEEIKSLKGICIFAAGNAQIRLNFNGAVVSMYYRSRGNSNSTLDFGTSGSLNKIVTDVSGKSQLHLIGEKLGCDALKLPAGGSSQITCKGKAL